MVRRYAAPVVLLFLLGVPAGCGGPAGPPTYPVSGKVLYRGEPLSRGTVLFIPEDGPAAGTAIADDGSFSLDAVAGNHRVGITSIPEPPPGATPENYDPPPALIPTRYSRPHTSGLTAEVNPGEENHVTFELQ